MAVGLGDAGASSLGDELRAGGGDRGVRVAEDAALEAFEPAPLFFFRASFVGGGGDRLAEEDDAGDAFRWGDPCEDRL